MKAEDLMIGDHITFRDVQNDSNCPKVKVCGLIGDDVYASIDGDPVLDVVDPDELAGIPLTPDILEKNGFGLRDNAFGGKSYILSDDYLIEDRIDRLCLVRTLPGHKYSTYFVLEIRYVHQLQHALRLCGIDKEITV